MQGEPVLSGIAKTPVARDAVFVGATNIEGDGQADLTRAWRPGQGGLCLSHRSLAVVGTRDKHSPARPATFGENLTLEGADETMVTIGDRFRWGDVAARESASLVRRASNSPYHANRADAPALMTISGTLRLVFSRDRRRARTRDGMQRLSVS